MRKYILLFRLILGIISCRFSRPVLAIQDRKLTVSIDSLKEKVIYKHRLYPCLRTGIAIGACIVAKTYNAHNKLIEKDISKNSNDLIRDGNVRSFSKQVYYDSLGRKTKIRYRIHQNHGTGGHTEMDTTVIVKR